MTPDPPIDPGLQPERTELAWRRTALGVGVGSLVSIRLLPATYGDPLWMLPGLAGVFFAGTVWVAARLRYAQTNTALRASDEGRLPGGILLLTMASFAATAGILSLGLVLFT